MKKLTLWFTLASFAVALTVISTAHAGPRGRNANQRARIHQGVESGQVTKAEQQQLNQEQRRIHRMEHRAGTDGKVTRGERARINRAQNKASADIYRDKHNGQVQQGTDLPAPKTNE